VCTDGQCVGQPWCGDGTCGAGEDCDQCPADCGCDDDHLCREGVCRPIGCEWVDDWCDYVGWQCGDDGCGTSCGECAKGETCVDNVCEAIEGDVVQPDQLTPDAEGDTSVADEERATGGGSSCAASNQGAPMASGTALVAFALGLVLLLRRKPLSR
jgi:hypothetical protein